MTEVGKKAEYRRDDYYFLRQEGRACKLLPFEDDSEPPYKSILAGLCILFFLAVLAILT